jgi:hypothetical protein
MSPVPLRSLFNPAKELANVPVELLYSRRKLFEKIVSNIARRKIQNHVQATGDRMAVTPQQFGMKVEQQMRKQSAFFLPAAGVGGALGAVTSPAGHRVEGAGRGAVKGTAAAGGAALGLPIGTLLALMATRGKFKPRPTRGMGPSPQAIKHLMTSLVYGGTPGAAAGGVGGFMAANSALGKPSWEKKTA